VVCPVLLDGMMFYCIKLDFVLVKGAGLGWDALVGWSKKTRKYNQKLVF
jgi:hypothetical protein